jgi:hypothetical protein
MTDLVKGTIEDLKKIGPKQGKFGDFYNHIVVLNGENYSKIASVDKESLVTADTEEPLEIGQEVSILFTENGTFKNIIKIETSNAAPVKKKVELEKKIVVKKEVVSKTNKEPKRAEVQKSTGTTNMPMSRMNAVKVAIAMLVGQGKLTGTLEEDMEKLVEISEAIVKYTTGP